MVRSEKTRQLIIEKTASIFNKKGYIGTYLSDITNATGLTKGSIYGNFKDKNEVALEAFKFNYKKQVQETNIKMSQLDRADEKLLVFLAHFKTAYIPIFKNGGCAILNTAVDSDDGNIELKQEVTKAIKNWIATTEQILTEGINKGEIKEINGSDFTIKMVALIEGSIMLAKTLNQPQILIKNIESLEKEIRDLIV